MAVVIVEFPFTSVTVNVTVLSPTLEQSKVVLDNVKVEIPQLSVDPLLISAGEIEALPVLSR